MINAEQRERHKLIDYADIYDAAPAAYLVLDRQGVIVNANLEAAFMIGRPREKLAGIPFALCTSLNADALRAHLREAVRERATAQMRLLFCGDHVDTAAPLVQLTSNPIRGSAGDAAGCRTLLTPLDAVNAHMKRLEALLGVADGLAVHSCDERTLLSIAAHLIVPAVAEACTFRITPDAEDRRSALELVVSAGNPRRVEELACAVRQAPDARDGVIVVHGATDGDAGAPGCVVAPVKVRGGVTYGTLALGGGPNARALANDVAAVEQLAARCARAIDGCRRERRMEAALEWRNRLLAMVVHDLRNPLTVLGLAAAKLLEVPDTADGGVGGDRRRGRRQVQTIARGIARMTRMVGDLADFAALEAGHLSVAPEPCDARRVLAEIIDAAALTAETKGVKLELMPLPAGCMIHCDKERIAQVLGNLLDNAMKFTPRGGRVELRCTEEADGVCLDVIDSGCGIEPALVAELFRPYAQARKTARHGRGLGLFISRGIIEAHGGTLRVETTGAGTGTTFRIRLPSPPLPS